MGRAQVTEAVHVDLPLRAAPTQRPVLVGDLGTHRGDERVAEPDQRGHPGRAPPPPSPGCAMGRRGRPPQRRPHTRRGRRSPAPGPTTRRRESPLPPVLLRVDVPAVEVPRRATEVGLAAGRRAATGASTGSGPVRRGTRSTRRRPLAASGPVRPPPPRAGRARRGRRAGCRRAVEGRAGEGAESAGGRLRLGCGAVRRKPVGCAATPRVDQRPGPTGRRLTPLSAIRARSVAGR